MFWKDLKASSASLQILRSSANGLKLSFVSPASIKPELLGLFSFYTLMDVQIQAEHRKYCARNF